MKAIYTAMASVRQIEIARAQSANQLANVSTVAFKQSYQHATNSVKIAGSSFPTSYQPIAVSEDIISLAAGPMQATGRKLDVYMVGATVLGVQASNGQTAFTRRGDLNVNELGQLTIGSGDLVMGDGGAPISVPLGQTLEISSDGAVLAYDPNAPEAPASEVARLLLRDASATTLVRRLDGLFEPAAQVNVGGDFDGGAVPAELVSGAIEGSAVNVAEMLVKTMENNRSFEARIRLVKEFKDLDQAGTSMIRMA